MLSNKTHAVCIIKKNNVSLVIFEHIGSQLIQHYSLYKTLCRSDFSIDTVATSGFAYTNRYLNP